MAELSNTTGRAVLAVSLSAALAATPSHGQGLNSWFDAAKDAAKKAGQRVTETLTNKENDKKQDPNKPGQNANGKSPSMVDIATGTVAAAGIGYCAYKARPQQGKSRSQNKLGYCALGALAGAAVTQLIGTKIADGLKEHEQRQVLDAASESLKTGEPVTVSLPDSGSTVSVAASGPATTKEMQVDLLVTPSGIGELTRLNVVGEPRVASNGVKLRAGPSDKSDAIGSLKPGDTVHALGQADKSGWILVSKWMQGATYPVPIATGYVSSKLLKPSDNKDYPGEQDVIPAVGGAKTVTVTAVVTCRSTKFDKVDAQGNKTQDTSTLCPGLDGTPITS